ncbi:MAG: hypothetical protein V1689_06175 [Pseudomonadota bacterium]
MMGKNKKLAVMVVIVSLCFSGAAYGQMVFLARKALGAISHLTTQGEGQSQRKGPEVATVLLEAKADKVYHTAVEILKGHQKVRITYQDDANRSIEFTYEEQLASLKVSRLQDDLSQLMIACSTASGKGASTSFVLDGVFRVCKEMGVPCNLAKD